MEPYIDKSAVAAEIEKRIKEVSQIEKASYEIGLCDAYKIVLRFLDTLEVKDMDEIVEDVKDTTMRDFAWKVHTMISEGKSVSEIDHYVCGVCDF